jgi:hypothetical protein
MQTDGNFVVYDAFNIARYWSDTHGNPGARITLQNDANLVIHNTSWGVIWNLGTCCW